jgi:23S rRNA (uracil1939-C5)-methyltransferase
MEIVELTLTDMANGGAALGRDERERVIFVPLAIAGERVEVEVAEDKKRYAHARLREVLDSAPSRVIPRCPHFGPCGGCQYQHIAYEAQLQFKEGIVRDQLARIGRIANAPVQPVWANPEPWHWGLEVTFSPTPEGQPGFWSPVLDQVMPIEVCYIIQPALLALFEDMDLTLPNLRRATLRTNDAGALLVALETEDIEPPSLETDLPVSVSLILPDGTAANLVGENYLVQTLKGRDFRVSAGCFFYNSLSAAEMVVDTVQRYAALSGTEKVLELFSGVGVLTAFLADQAEEVVAVEINADAVEDMVINLAEKENVTVYEGFVEEVAPLIEFIPDVMVVNPPSSGLPVDVLDQIGRLRPTRLIYSSTDLATLARDARRLVEIGYQLAQLQPIDMFPQTYEVQTVSLWNSKPADSPT